MTVALDTGGAAAAGPWIDMANPSHPALIDEAHVMDELFGVVNVPSWIWIDEHGTIVRPPEPAWPGTSRLREMMKGITPENIDPYLEETLVEVRKMKRDLKIYPAMLRAWIDHGEHALTSDQVLSRSRDRSPDVAKAAAHFELGQHLVRAGHHDDAVPHFRDAHRLQPENWTYKRQAWSMVHPLQGPTDHYESDWVKDVREIGYENYYPALEP